MMWLRGQQNILNDILHTRGHVFLNEVYDALGFPHTPQGAVLGWIDGEGDNCIDFGLYDQNKENVRRFVNGVDNVIMLEFNHDGVIWDKIWLPYDGPESRYYNEMLEQYVCFQEAVLDDEPPESLSGKGILCIC